MKRHWLQWLISGGCIALGVLAVLQAQRNLPQTAAAFAPGWKGTEVLPRQAVPTGDPSPPTVLLQPARPATGVPVTLVSGSLPAGEPQPITGGAFVHRFEEVSAMPPRGEVSAMPSTRGLPPVKSAEAVQVLFEETVTANVADEAPPTVSGAGMPPRVGGDASTSGSTPGSS